MTKTEFKPPFILRHTNAYGERHYFQNLGGMWPHNPTRRLIERTTSKAAEARTFATPEEAREILATAGLPTGWELLDADGRFVE